jgi:hypothetical protein
MTNQTDHRLTLREYYEPELRRYQDAMEASGLGRDWRDLTHLHNLLGRGDVDGFQFALTHRLWEVILAVFVGYPENYPDVQEAHHALVNRLISGDLSWDAVDYTNPTNLKELENVALSETER